MMVEESGGTFKDLQNIMISKNFIGNAYLRLQTLNRDLLFKLTKLKNLIIFS